MRGRTAIQFKRFSAVSLLRLGGILILGVLTLQVLTAAVLLVIAALGKRRQHEVSFPHRLFEEVPVARIPSNYTPTDVISTMRCSRQSMRHTRVFIWRRTLRKRMRLARHFKSVSRTKPSRGLPSMSSLTALATSSSRAAFKSSFHPAIHVLELCLGSVGESRGVCTSSGPVLCRAEAVTDAQARAASGVSGWQHAAGTIPAGQSHRVHLMAANLSE